METIIYGWSAVWAVGAAIYGIYMLKRYVFTPKK